MTGPESLRRYVASRLGSRTKERLRQLGPPLMRGAWRLLEYAGVGPRLPADVPADLLLICNHYPDAGARRHAGGEFVRTRARAYRAAGLRVTVVEVNRDNHRVTTTVVDDIVCLRLNRAGFERDGERLLAACADVAVHAPTPWLVDWLSRHCAGERLSCWFHGAEVRDYRRLAGNYTPVELQQAEARLERTRAERVRVARQLFTNPPNALVFVSDYLRTIAEIDSGQRCAHAEVIPNPIDCEFYAGPPKPASQRHRVLLIRSFATNNYGADIAIAAILDLLRSGRAPELFFTVRGFGRRFTELTAPLREFERVDIREGVLDRVQMRELYRTHGVMLAPSRHDTQGVTTCEAMAAGLVPVTHRVAAIPEFVRADCGELVWSPQPRDFAAGILRAVADGEQFSRRSLAARAAMQRQCGYAATVARELAVLDRRRQQAGEPAAAHISVNGAGAPGSAQYALDLRGRRLTLRQINGDEELACSVPGACDFRARDATAVVRWLQAADRVAAIAGRDSVLLVAAGDPLLAFVLMLVLHHRCRYVLYKPAPGARVSPLDFALLGAADAIVPASSADAAALAQVYPGPVTLAEGPPQPGERRPAPVPAVPMPAAPAAGRAPVRILLVAYFAGPCASVGAARVNYWYECLDNISGGRTQTQLATAIRPHQAQAGIHYVPDLHGITLTTASDLVNGAGPTQVAREIELAGHINTLSFYWRFALERYFRHAAQTFDVVVISGNPFPCFEFARFARAHWGAKVVLDYRDPFANNPAMNYRAASRAVARELEQGFNAQADLLLTVNGECKNLLQNDNDVATLVVENGVDERAVTGLAPTVAPGEGVRLVHAGSFNAYRRPGNLVAAVHAGPYELHHVGHAGPLSAAPGVVLHGRQPYPRAMELIAAAHCGVVFLSASHFETTTKIYDYLYCGLDVLVISPDGVAAGPIAELDAARERIHWVADEPAALTHFLQHYRPAARAAAPDNRFTRAASTAVLAQALTTTLAPARTEAA